MTKIYLIRHAQALGNQEQRFQGNTDRPLSPLGLEQLEYLAPRCRELGARVVYTSPLSRARDTAQAVDRFLKVPVVVMDDLREIHCGDWENQRFADIDRLWPEERRIWKEEPWNYCAPNGESMRQVYDRAVGALRTLESKHPGQCIAVVCHGCVLRTIFAFARGGLEHFSDRDEWMYNASVSCIEMREGQGTLTLENDVEWLPERLRTI